MRRNQGFTITELMITVVIIGVLASIAIPSFTNYIYKARVTEATNFLGGIKQRQEAYRSEFGQYCAVDGDDWGTWNPAAIPGIDPVVWATTTEWQQLGAKPDGPIRFRYATIAGFPGVSPPADSNLDSAAARSGRRVTRSAGRPAGTSPGMVGRSVCSVISANRPDG